MAENDISIPADLLDLFEIKVTPKTNQLKDFLVKLLNKQKILEKRIVELDVKLKELE